MYTSAALFPHGVKINPRHLIMNYRFDLLLFTTKRNTACCVSVAILLTLAACGRQKVSLPASERGETVPADQIRSRAEQGDVSAQASYGKFLIEGGGSRPDYVQAASWFHRAADQGSAEAQFYLAGMYEAGRGVQRDYAESVRWNLKAAQAGHSDAQYALALLYATGKGVPKDKPASVKWFRAAAEQGLVEAQFNLAQRYQHGQGVETNLAEAYKWFALAARNGLRDATKESQPIKSELSAAEINAAEKFAESFVPVSSPPNR